MDSEVVKKIQKICRTKADMDGNSCVGISFHDESWPLESSLRNNPNKHKILDLVFELKGLRHLNLRKARLGKIKNACLPCLVNVDLSCNDLSEIPEFCLGEEIRGINLGSNLIEAIDFVPAQTQVLKLHKNHIRRLPKLPPSLVFLNLYFNDFEFMPNLELPRLEFFSFGGTRCKEMAEMPESLIWLSLVANSLGQIPDWFSGLRNLRGLRLAKNRIRTLPESFGSLDRLEELTLYKNSIDDLPETFFSLNLKKLNISANPLSVRQRHRIKQAFVGCSFLRT